MEIMVIHNQQNQTMDYKNLTPEQVKKFGEKTLVEAKRLLAKLVTTENKTSVQNLRDLDNLNLTIAEAFSVLSAMESLHPQKDVRDATEEPIISLSSFAGSLSLNCELYLAVKDVDVSNSDEATKRMFEHTVRDFKRSGVDKDDETRQKIQELQDKITEITVEFDRNIREDRRTLAVSAEETEGLPQDFINRLKTDIDGNKLISTDPSDLYPALTFVKNGSVRKKLSVMYNSSCPQNENLLQQILEAKAELSKLLGHANYAGLQFEVDMVKNVETVDTFLQSLDDMTKAVSARELEELKDLARQDGTLTENNTISSWDSSYYLNLLKKTKFNYDSKDFRPYLPYEQVETAILGIYSELFGIEFVQNTEFPVWADDAKCFDVFEEGKLIGRTILDMHPREGKFKHAAFDVLTPGIKDRQIPESYLMCNFSGGEKVEETLIQISDVQTFFHEFGHMLHGIFGSNQEWSQFSGLETEWDFVEVPSQLMEQWLLDPAVLQRIGKHYTTDEPIPTELIEKRKSSENFGKAISIRRQFFLSKFALDIHTESPNNIDFSKMWLSLADKFSPFSYTKELSSWNTFGHLTNYAAKYYCYMWSLALVYDAMTQFDRNNMMDSAPAKRFRDLVLKQGGVRDAVDMLEDFLGRKHSFDAFENWLKE